MKWQLKYIKPPPTYGRNFFRGAVVYLITRFLGELNY